ncbi:MAG: hypothetical protein D6798_14675 [Deltaproteobacteria bacterium]|nr:MAG: hypothetical protein D6798_14675 [Deltaproteobacteria bacterium]
MTTLLAILDAVVGSAAAAVLFRRAVRRPRLLPEELALAAAFLAVPVGAVWLWAWGTDRTLLGFGAPWTWLTAAHLHVAGCGSLVLTALTCRLLPAGRGLAVVRGLLLLHPAAFATVALGILGQPGAELAGAALYLLLYGAQLAVTAVGLRDRLRGRDGPAVLLLLVALLVPVFTVLPGLRWAAAAPLWDLAGMVRHHGLPNAIGHLGLGLAAMAWLRPAPRAPRLAVPFSRLRARGVVDEALFGSGPATPRGLSDSLAAYARPDLDVGRLHPDVIAFYEQTADFDLDVRGDWHVPFRLAGRLWADGIARAMGQLGLPAPGTVLQGAALTSRIVDVDDARDGRSGVRGWVRRWRDTGRPLYLAAYAEHVRDGVRVMNIAFPLPGGNLTSVLHLSHDDTEAPGGIVLSSRSDDGGGGQPGIYLVFGGHGHRLPMDESIHVWPETSPAADGTCLRARHHMWLLGMEFLTLDYRIRRRG